MNIDAGVVYWQLVGFPPYIELLCQPEGEVFLFVVVLEVCPDAVRDAAFEDAHGFSFAFAAFSAALVVGMSFAAGA